MYILGISGSPRVGGNTEILLDKALLGAKSKGARTEKVILNKLKMTNWYSLFIKLIDFVV